MGRAAGEQLDGEGLNAEHQRPREAIDLMVERPYPALASVLSLALTTVADAFSLKRAEDTPLINALERLGAEAMIEEYRALIVIVNSFSDPSGSTKAQTFRAPSPGPPRWL